MDKYDYFSLVILFILVFILAYNMDHLTKDVKQIKQEISTLKES